MWVLCVQPCRSHIQRFGAVSLEECALFITRLLACNFTADDVDTLFTDAAAVLKSRVMRNPDILGKRTDAPWKGEGGGLNLYTAPKRRYIQLKNVRPRGCVCAYVCM